SPDGKALALAGLHTSVEVRKLGLVHFLFQVEEFLSTGKALGAVRILDTGTGREMAFLKGHPGLVTAVTFSPDGTFIASKSHDGTVKLWEAATGRERWTGKTPVSSAPPLYGHRDLAFTPDGKTLATGNFDGTLTLWDVATGQARTVIKSHSDRVG